MVGNFVLWLRVSRAVKCNFDFFLVWFLFYGPSTHLRSFRERSVNLATLFLGNPPRQFTLRAHSFASNWQLLFLNQRKRENGRRNIFMTKSPRKNVPDVGIELGAACMPSEHASDRATAPGQNAICNHKTNNLSFTSPNDNFQCTYTCTLI